MKHLIVIDMQQDFISGSLANTAAQEIVEPMANFIKTFEGNLICTFDTHGKNYLNTQEGKNLPIEHCIEDTVGWKLDNKIFDAITKWLNTFSYNYCAIHKHTFGYTDWAKVATLRDSSQIIICGVVSDICVISNALILKATYPEKEIIVLEDLCAGLTKEKHVAALEIMRSCQIKVKNSKDIISD